VAGYALLFLNLADASCRGIKAPPPDQENVLKNMLEFIEEQAICEKLHDWLCLRQLELKLDLDSESGRAGGCQGSGNSSSGGGGGAASLGGGGHDVRAHDSGCGCAGCSKSNSCEALVTELLVILFQVAHVVVACVYFVHFISFLCYLLDRM
jgi:hypothetical protein